MNKISKYGRLVKFSHTIFAMPFALLSFTYAVKTMSEGGALNIWVLLVQVVLCMAVSYTHLTLPTT